MIDLKMIQDDEVVELHRKIHFYNYGLSITNLLFLILLFFRGIPVVLNDTFPPIMIIMIRIGLAIVLCLTLIDLYMAIEIKRASKRGIDRVSRIYVLPAILDLLLLFAFGLGIIRLFFRIVIYGNINPDQHYFDDEDPLFSS